MNKRLYKLTGMLVFALTSYTTLLALAGPGLQATANLRDEWNTADLEVLASLRISQLPPSPKDPSNSIENLPAAIELGQRLFHDARFSRNLAVSCASCHDPKKQFQDGLPVGRGVGEGARRAMPIVGVAHSPWLFWDGRKDSLWAQALGPLEDAVEHGGNRTRYAHLMQTHYRAEYEAIFHAMPDLSHMAQDAGPSGTAAEKLAWDSMAAKERKEITRVFANMGKAIAAYEKTLTYGEAPFDRYVEGTIAKVPGAQDALTPQEVNGLRVFIGKGQCVTCHAGPLLTDQHFHNTGIPPRDPAKPDPGRAAAIDRVQKDEFNCIGPFSDAKPDQCQELRFMATDKAPMLAAFKTPSLRNVALRPPYMHAGQFTSTEQAIRHYIKAPAAVAGHTELSDGRARHFERKPIKLTEEEIRDLVSFLGTLTGPILDGTQR
ncbi:MAG: cytochrome c peroxidase [Gallionella sp.]|nr:cytochrome c peroxidase [Gallionella sp.]